MLAFHIGGEDAEYVRVRILRDNGDGWFSADVGIVAGGFRAAYPANFNSWAFHDFVAQLEEMHRAVAGCAVFTSCEAQLELVAECATTGHIRLRGEAMDRGGTGNELRFSLELDQTYLPAVINTLRAALEHFPPNTV